MSNYCSVMQRYSCISSNRVSSMEQGGEAELTAYAGKELVALQKSRKL